MKVSCVPWREAAALRSPARDTLWFARLSSVGNSAYIEFWNILGSFVEGEG